MFNNFIKGDNGTTTTKILATLLVITLTFANFALMFKSIAIDLQEQDTRTNSPSVKFSAYLDSNNASVKEIDADINKQDLNLYITIAVEGNGKLEKGTIDFSDSNFYLKEDEKTLIKGLDTIFANNQTTIELPIVSRKNSEFNLSLLNMISKIKLTGEYIDENGNVTNVDSTKEVKINWESKEISKENLVVSQEVITNGIYEIEGQNKRVLQVLVKSNIQDNKVPVEKTTIEIENPIKDVKPEEVKVTTFNTSATNGKGSIEFNKKDGSSWNYNKDENKTVVQLINSANAEGNISWQKNATDEIIVTYIYEEDVEVKEFSSDVKVLAKLYANENEIENENNLTLETIEEKGNIVDIKNSITRNIYKGYMYIGEDTEYKTKNDIYVSYAMGNKLYVVDTGDKVNSESLSIYYKSTQINKTQALDILGNEGTIKVYNAENTNEPVSEIELSKENEEEYFTVNYEENVGSIIIETSAPLKEGKLEIINVKAIKVLDLEKIEEATKLDVNTKVQVIDLENKELASSMQTGTVNLVEPETSIDILLDKASISNQVQNELKLTTILNANNNSNKLFNNPTINIELPKEITDVTLENISLLYEDELKIKTSEVITNENGNKVLALQLEGKQTKYNASEAQMGANIVMDLKVKANQFMVNKNVELKATCINGEENVKKLANIDITSKNGLVTKNSIKIEESKVEELNKSVTATIGTNSNIKIEETIINNNGKKISNVVLNGKIPEGTVLNGEVITNLNNASISYADKENPTQEDWKNTIEDYTKVKAFKLEIEELEQASNFEITYNLQPIENALKEKDYFESQVNINYLLDEKIEQEEIKFKVINAIKDEGSDMQQTDNLMIKVKPKTTLETLHEGQIVTYKIELINISSETLKNIKLDYIVPEGATYTEFTYSQGIDIEYTDNAELKNKEWDIDIIEPNQTIEKEVTIRVKKGTEQIVNNVIVKNENNDILGQIVTEAKKVEKGDLEVKLSRRDNFESTLEEKSKIQYIVIIKNNSGETKNNVLVTSKVPEGTNYYPESEENNGWIYEEKINQLKYTIDSIKPGEQKEVRFEVEVKADNKNSERIIENIAQITTEDNKKYETNIYRSIVLSAQWEINMTSEHGQTIKEGEPVKYIIKVKNIGKRVSSVSVENVLPEEIQFRKLTYYIDSQNKVEDTLTRTNINVIHSLDIGEILTIEIEGVTFNLEDDVQSKEIKNVAKINLGDGEYLESEVITSTIINEDYIAPELPEEPENPEQPEEPQEPEQPGESENPNNPEEPNDPENPTEPEKTYSISGLVWLDENKNGARDNNEKVLQGIQVILLDKDGNIVKDEKGNSINTITTITGTYKFNELKLGEYIVVFKYDTDKYAVTKYQVQEAKENQNSDVISKQLTIDNKNMLVGATDIIKIQNNDIQNIDMGLVENAKFDLSLEKYIERIIVTDDKESVNYTFEEAKLAKIEIDAKKLAKSSILIQYKIKVSNEGDIQGYVGDVIDYLPKELEFNSEMNPDWYLDSNGKLHNVTLEKEAIEPGTSKTLNLVLTKTLNNNSTGTITNNAEIAKSSNLQNINDIDSIVANNKQGEDDQGEASLIISIKTGSPAMYIGIVLLSLAVLSIGIYLINKKVIKGQI